jgi:hypothetical protein
VGFQFDNYAVALMREGGEVLVRYPPAKPPFAVPHDSEFLGDMRKAEKGSFTARSPVEGKARIAGYAKVGRYPVYGSSGVDKSAIVSAWISGMIPEAIIVLLAGLALSLLCRFALRSAQQQQLFIHALDDTNQRLELEMTRRERAEASLMQKQRLEAMGQLTGGIACPVRLDVSEFDAAILVGNTRDAMPSGEALTISTRLLQASVSGSTGRQVQLCIKRHRRRHVT